MFDKISVTKHIIQRNDQQINSWKSTIVLNLENQKNFN